MGADPRELFLHRLQHAPGAAGERAKEILASSEYLPVRDDVEPLKQIVSIVPSRVGVAENFISPKNLLAYTESSEKIVEKLFH